MKNIKIYEGLKKLHQQIEAMRLAKAQNELYDANRFNPFQFMQTDENGLSRILAFLLDSNEAHGQRDLFIRSFLQYLRLPKFLAYEKIIVTTEKPVKNSTKRRHDIFLEAWIGNELVWVMSIENKLRGASDQANQINDYWEDLGCYPTKNQHIVYLPVQIEQPSRESIKKSNWQNLQSNKQASIFSARDVVKWLEQTPIVAPSVQSFINQFKQFIQEDIMNLPSNSNELVTHIINDQDMLAAAMLLITSGKYTISYCKNWICNYKNCGKIIFSALFNAVGNINVGKTSQIAIYSLVLMRPKQSVMVLV